MTAGYTAVNVFIIVSGFVITHLILQQKEDYGPYIVRRAFRIFPVYVAAVLAAIAVEALYLEAYGAAWVVEADMRTERAALQWANFWPHAIGHATMLHGIPPDSVLPYSSSAFLAPAWSLSLEWQFYLLAPVLIGLLSRTRGTLYVATAISLMLLYAGSHGLLGYWKYPSFLPLAINYFLIGIFSRMVLEKNGMILPDIVFLLVIIAAGRSGMRELLIWSVFFVIVLIEQGRLPRPAPATLAKAAIDVFAWNRIVRSLGRWSYSTYLIHIPIFSIVVGAGRTWLGMTSRTDAVILVALSIPIVLAASWGMYELVEKPGMAAGRRLASRLSGVAESGVKTALR
jgi:peptidoglycan/LPS O-acetylase OafA/YrhL